MTRKKTHKEEGPMPSVAKKLVVVHNDEPPAAQPTVRSDALRLLEALLFASAEPLDEATLARQLPDGVNVRDALAQLKAEYTSRGVNLVRIGKKWTFRTADDLSWLLTKQTIETRKLSRAAVETLSIVAYHQPVTRAEIEEIRGVVTAAGTLDVLLRTGWIRPRGRRKAPGRPITYGTTEAFLSHFGLEEVADLPGLDELKGAGLLEGTLPPNFEVPLPSDDTTLRDDEDPLEPGDLDFGLAPKPDSGEP
jgi:segregation and condensation protein B